MSEHTERLMLAMHGTADVVLPPSAILAAAKEDFERRLRNKAKAALDGDINYERYAFGGSKVVNAKSPRAVLERALRWRQKFNPLSAMSKPPKLSLLQLTASIDSLMQAIDMAGPEEE